VRKHLDEAQRLGRKQIGLQFAPELDQLSPSRSEARMAAIDALVQFESLDYLREHRKFSFNVAHATLVEALTLLLRD
jgi:hypothetical protein